MPDDLLTSRERYVVASYWRQYDAATGEDDGVRRNILRALIEFSCYEAAYRRLTTDLNEFHNERREEDADAERRRG